MNIPYIPANVQDCLRTIIRYIGDDPDREGLKETPDRVMCSYAEMFRGYHEDPKALMKTFEDGACDEMVILRDIQFTSFCEHHMLPFMGVAHIAYIPNKRIIGISKLARLLDMFACRLQVQERLTTQITATLDEHLQPLGSACVIKATHLCMVCRGVRKQGPTMITSSLTGAFKLEHETRNEFIRLISR